MKRKPSVTYSDLAFCKEDAPARVFLRGQGWMRTSRVLEIVPHCDGPVFETLNTIYWPSQTDGTPINVGYKYVAKPIGVL